MKLTMSLLAMIFLLLFMHGSAAAQRDRMKLGETLSTSVSRAKSAEKRTIKVKETKPPDKEKLETKVMPAQKTK